MIECNEKVIKKGSFKGIAYSSIKKYVCEKGELVLTPKKLIINCEGAWSKTFKHKEIRLEAFDGCLEIRDIWYGRLLFKLVVDEAEEWWNAFQKIESEYLRKYIEKFWEDRRRRPEEWKKLLDISPTTLRKIHDAIRIDMTQFRRKNLIFNLEIQKLLRILKNRNLKAFIVVHSYVAWYEWTKGLLSKIYKAKFGRGPENDEELIRFLSGYASLRILDTEEWKIKANQIRNCVAHEKFYYDYKHSEIVFVVKKKEKRIRLREIEFRLIAISHTYSQLLQFIKEKVEKGKISPPESIF